jgi:hypothetical protein
MANVFAVTTSVVGFHRPVTRHIMISESVIQLGGPSAGIINVFLSILAIRNAVSYDANFLLRVDADFQLIISEAPSQCVNGKCTPPPPGPCDPACGEFM